MLEQSEHLAPTARRQANPAPLLEGGSGCREAASVVEEVAGVRVRAGEVVLQRFPPVVPTGPSPPPAPERDPEPGQQTGVIARLDHLLMRHVREQDVLHQVVRPIPRQPHSLIQQAGA